MERSIIRREIISKSKNAQEVHEAIRPTHIENMEVNGSEAEKNYTN